MAHGFVNSDEVGWHERIRDWGDLAAKRADLFWKGNSWNRVRLISCATMAGNVIRGNAGEGWDWDWGPVGTWQAACWFWVVMGEWRERGAPTGACESGVWPFH